MVRKTKAEAEKTRERILKSAKKLFEKQGYAGSSIGEICKESGVTKGALFHHFSSKENLFREVWTNLQKKMDEEANIAAIAARSKTDLYASFIAGCRVYLTWASRPDYQKIVLTDGPSVLGLAGWYEADNELGRDNTMVGMRWLAKHGKINGDLLEPLAIMFHNALNGAGFAISRGNAGISPESALKSFEYMLRSLKP